MATAKPSSRAQMKLDSKYRKAQNEKAKANRLRKTKEQEADRLRRIKKEEG